MTTAAQPVLVKTMPIWIDVEGYVVRDYGPYPPHLAERTVVSFGKAGRHIEGRSGRVVQIEQSAHSPIWRQAAKQVTDLEGLAAFMSEFGWIGRSWAKGAAIPRNAEVRRFPDDAQQRRKFGPIYVQLKEPQSASEVHLAGIVEAIQDMANCVDCLDRDGFLALTGGALTAEAEIAPSASIAPWTIRLPSLMALLRYQMWAEFGADASQTPAVSGFRSCVNCGRSMPIGGRRGATYRVDAKYCSDSCRVAYHQRKKRPAGAK